MIATPNDDNPGFMAKETEHCFRLMRPGQTYYLTIEDTVLCADCALVEGVIRVRGDLAVEIKRDRLLIQRGEVEVEVFPDEVRHLVNALAGGGGEVGRLESKRDGVRVNLRWRGRAS